MEKGEEEEIREEETSIDQEQAPTSSQSMQESKYNGGK